jgi:hypothetical protein
MKKNLVINKSEIEVREFSFVNIVNNLGNKLLI